MNVPGRYRRQLALALHGGNAVGVRLPVAARPDGNVKPVGFSVRRLVLTEHSRGNTMKANECAAKVGESLLQDERAKSFVKSWDELMAAIASTIAAFAQAS